jgi:large subunit ribosomal protein L20
MTRVRSVPAARRRRKKVLKRARGFVGGRRRLYRTARESVQRALAYSYRDRRVKKRTFRRLWILRINARLKSLGFSYGQFMAALRKSKIALNRKILSDLAVNQPAVFDKIAKAVLKK